MHSSLSFIDHRPWPLPTDPWRWRQSWLELAFLHFRADAVSLQRQLPHGLQLEQYDGSAWVSVVPFRMHDVAPKNWPSIPPLRSFPELNVRTYVTDGRKPGVWFFSLDADCLPIVLGGRMLYGLPYFKASMSITQMNERLLFRSTRNSGSVRFDAEYEGVGEVFEARIGTLEHWLTERYCLYSSIREQVFRTDVHHKPWPLRHARVAADCSALLTAACISTIEASPSLCHCSSGVDVVSFPTEKVVLP